MSDKYLNDGVKFKCSGSATVRLSSKDIAHSSIKLKGKGILTDDTKLSICITGNCNFLSKPNAPLPKVISYYLKILLLDVFLAEKLF